jgi:hypothetical protein
MSHRRASGWSEELTFKGEGEGLKVCVLCIREGKPLSKGEVRIRNKLLRK